MSNPNNPFGQRSSTIGDVSDVGATATPSGGYGSTDTTTIGSGATATTSLGGDTTAARETERLIASDKVEGTSVRRSNGERVGTIERVMIDKRSGKVAYAIMSFGGFLGLGESYYPLPWSVLTYNEELDAYEVNLNEDDLRDAPQAQTSDSFDWSDRELGSRVNSHYRTTDWAR